MMLGGWLAPGRAPASRTDRLRSRLGGRQDGGTVNGRSHTLSVVIVTRDEADRVRGSIESVLDATEQFEGTEVVLVDSNSSDETVDIAVEYPITVLRIPSDDLSTPAAGRFVGSKVTNGEYVLFVDGDIHVEGEWLDDAIRAVRTDDDLAGVDGHVDDLGADEPTSVDYLRGVALYDAESLASVGGFDPWLQSLEDVDLGLRLTRAGFELVRLPVVVGTEDMSFGLAETVRRWRSGYPLGEGQVLRRALDDPRMLTRWASWFRRRIATTGWLGLGGIFAVKRRVGLLLAWATINVVGFVAASVTRGVEMTVQRILSYATFPLCVVVGSLQPSRQQSEYPIERIEVVKDAGETGD